MIDADRLATAVRNTAGALPFELPVDPDLDRHLARLDADVGSAAVRTAAAGLVLAGLPPAGVALALGATAPAFLLLALFAGSGFLVRAGPRWLATARRARALGAVPDLIGLAVLRARVTPTPEDTAAFAAEHGRGPLADALGRHCRRTRGEPGTAWDGFVRDWEGDPTIRRAVPLLRAAVDAPRSERHRRLDRALEAALAGTRERTERFAADVRGPTDGIYAFGVVLPLSLVAALPAAQAAGLPVGVPVLVAVYDVLLPVVLLGACAWVLARRPVAFPPAPVPRDHPDAPDRRRAAAALIGCGLGAWLLHAIAFPPWTAVTAPGVAVGAALVVRYRPPLAVRERVREVEAGLPDALALAGRRLDRGDPPETALAAVGERLDGPTAEVFAAAARVQRRLRVGPRRAFLGDGGALAAVPSPRTRAAAALLGLAAGEGPHGGRVLVESAEHVEDLRDVERAARRDLSGLVGTLRSTACCFAPLVGGVTVALAGRLAAAGSGRFLEPLPVDALGAAVGGYVLLLAAILAAFAAALDRGFDRALLGYHVGVGLLSAGSVYPLAALAAAALL